MLINKWKYFIRCSSILFCLFQLTFTNLNAQTIWENPKLPVNSFLSRQAQKGNINITDFILPLSRKKSLTS
jgi:hypothetical protein